MIDYDLHIHTTASDGIFSPEEILKAASLSGLKGISVTDHDTVDALETCERLSPNYKLDFIPGIELSTEYDELEVHMLGYYIDYKNPKLLELLNTFQNERLDRANKMISRINNLGYEITMEEVRKNLSRTSDGDLQNNSIGRPHLARALIKSGYFQSMNQVFDKLLGNGKPGYVERFKYNSIEAIGTIRKYGGISVLAHPGLIKIEPRGLEKLIATFVNNGLKGIEVYHTDHTNETSYMLAKIANKYNLLVTGGSDYHAPSASRNLSIGYKGVTTVDIEKLKIIANK